MKQTNERLCALAQKGDAAALDSLIDNSAISILYNTENFQLRFRTRLTCNAKYVTINPR